MSNRDGRYLIDIHCAFVKPLICMRLIMPQRCDMLHMLKNKFASIIETTFFSPHEASLPVHVASELSRLERHLSASSAAPDAPLVIYVSKMVSVPASLLPR